MTYYGEMISALDVKSCRTKTNKVKCANENRIRI